MAPTKLVTAYRLHQELSSRARFMVPIASGQGVPDVVREYMNDKREYRIALCAKIHAHIETHYKPAGVFATALTSPLHSPRTESNL